MLDFPLPDPLTTPQLAAWIALSPQIYFFRIGMASFAFWAATNANSVILRVLGLAWLLVTGLIFSFIGVTQYTLIDLLLGAAALFATGYAWWYTRA